LDDDAVTIRRAVAQLGRRRRNDAVPLKLRRRAVAYALARRPGVTWGQLGTDLGLAGSTITRWCALAARSPAEPERGPEPRLVPVIVGPGPSDDATLVLVSPRGFRVEGLHLDDVVELLQRLS
jgi:transposase